MTRIVLLILLNAFVCGKALAQCTAFEYLLKIEGFSDCDPATGSFCIGQSSDSIIPISGCEDYVFELSWPTTEFIYSDLGAWTIVGRDPLGNTVLRLEPTLIFDGRAFDCLTGRLQNLNTVFTLTVVNRNDPTDVLSTESFPFNDVKEIGNPGTTTFLSGLIQSGVLLPANLARTNGQRLRIEGELVVDTDYSFRANPFVGNGQVSELIFAEGASLRVLDNRNLLFSRATLRACPNERWAGVIVNDAAELEINRTQVRDATTAIELLDGAALSVGVRNRLLDNLTGIGAYGYNSKDIDIRINGFDPFVSDLSINGGGSGRGIVLENVSDQDIRSVYFENLREGIRARSANLLLSNSVFDSNFFGAFLTGNSEVLAIENVDVVESNRGLYISSFTNNVSMENSFTAQNRIAVVVGRGVQDRVRISDNQFFMDDHSLVGSIHPSQGTVVRNSFSSERANLRLFGLGTGKHRWGIEFNDLTASEGSTNASLRRLDCSRFFRNVISFGGTGVEILSGRNNFVGYNAEITTLDRGIAFQDSPTAELRCNELESAISINAFDNSLGTFVGGNEMNDFERNLLQYGSPNSRRTMVGEQVRTGNVFNPGTEGLPGAIDYTEGIVSPRINRYTVAETHSIGDPMYPFFVSNDPSWFDRKGFQEYTCPETPMSPPFAPDPDRDTAAIHAYFTVASSLDTLPEPALAPDAKLKVLRQLRNLGMVVPGGEYTPEIAALDASVYGRYVDFETRYAAMVEYSPEVVGTVDSLQNLLDAQTEAINEFWATRLDTVQERYILASADTVAYDGLREDMINTTGQLRPFATARRQRWQTEIPVLRDTLAAIRAATEDVVLRGLIDVQDLELITLDTGFTGFTATQENTIYTLAAGCNKYVGEAVYLARALEATHLDPDLLANYSDECMEGPVAISTNTSAVEQEEGLLYPNPVNQEIRYRPARDYAGPVTLNVVDLHGRTVASRSYNGLTMGVDRQLDVTTLPIGFYLLRVNDAEGGLLAVDKFLIAR